LIAGPRAEVDWKVAAGGSNRICCRPLWTLAVKSSAAGAEMRLNRDAGDPGQPPRKAGCSGALAACSRACRG
jgi:hypothetical protein